MTLTSTFVSMTSSLNFLTYFHPISITFILNIAFFLFQKSLHLLLYNIFFLLKEVPSIPTYSVFDCFIFFVFFFFFESKRFSYIFNYALIHLISSLKRFLTSLTMLSSIFCLFQTLKYSSLCCEKIS